MLLLISDANILIDLEDGGIIALLFLLPWKISTPDVLFAEEMEEQHPGLPALGLALGELGEEAMGHVQRLSQTYPGPSRYDCMALALALALQEACPLLSGDRALRQAADQEGVEVHGTVWTVEQMLIHGLLDADAARQAFNAMRRTARRLPWVEAEAMIKRICEPME